MLSIRGFLRLAAYGVILTSFWTLPAQAAPVGPAAPELDLKETYGRGRVSEVIRQETNFELDEEGTKQELRIILTSGPETGRDLTVDYEVRGAGSRERALRAGDRVVVVKSEAPDGVFYYVTEIYRLPVIYSLIGLFALTVIVFGGQRGFMAFVGLALTILVISLYIIPQISQGVSPLLVSFVGTILIASSSLFVAHGANRRTLVAFLSLLSTIGFALSMAVLFVRLARLSGLGTEEAFYLQFAPTGAISVSGLLLGGIIIGALGVLDDVTTAQAAAVYELKRANRAFGGRELYQRGLAIGREHIASLVNTLVLAYTGASFPLLLLFTAYSTPFWVTLNTELVVEEMVRTLVGSLALVCAVPLTTALAAYVFRHDSGD